jgi:hypothetical protein
MAEILWSRPICKVAGDYLAWPSIAVAGTGEVLVVFSGDREEHVCPYGKTLLIRSSDGGETWTDPAIINNTPLDDRDAGIIELASGTLVMSWFTSATWEHFDTYRALDRWQPGQIDAWARHCSKIPEETRRAWLGSWTRRSTDGGRTWEPHVPSIVSAPHGPVQAAGGELLYAGTAVVDGRDAVLLATSTDEARSWQVAGTVLHLDDHPGEHHRFSEPHVAELAGGELLCILRTDNGAAGIHSCRSGDRGRTWSPPEPTGMIGYDQPGHLIRLADGRLLCTYGRRIPPFGQRACLSEDEGRTWRLDAEIVLRDDGPNTDLGYPASAEVSPGELLTVYYQVDRPGEKVSINATRWSLGGG